MEISVIIISYNSEKYISACIRSYLDAEPAVRQVIVVDNASVDQTVAIVAREFPQVELLAKSTNDGYGASINQGVQRARGDLVVVSNDDLVVDSHWTREVMRVLEARGDCGMVASKVLYLEHPEVINSTGVLYFPDMTGVNRGLDEPDRGQYECEEEVLGAYGAIMALRRSVIEDVGAFEESYWLFREEDEYAWRLRLRGYRTYYCPTAKVYHKRSAHTQRYSPMKLFYSERNRVWNVLKFLPWYYLPIGEFWAVRRFWLHLRHMGASGGGSGAKVSKAREHGRLRLIGVVCRAWLSALAGCPRIFRQRWDINRRAVSSPSERVEWLRRFAAGESDLLK